MYTVSETSRDAVRARLRHCVRTASNIQQYMVSNLTATSSHMILFNNLRGPGYVCTTLNEEGRLVAKSTLFCRVSLSVGPLIRAQTGKELWTFFQDRFLLLEQSPNHPQKERRCLEWPSIQGKATC